MTDLFDYQDVLVEHANDRRAARGGWLMLAMATILLVLMG